MKLPPNLKSDALSKIRNRPGVYHFSDEDGGLLYVGKSVSLKKRIKSHFRNPANSHKSQKLFMHTAEITTFPTAGDIGAQLLELAHIKNKQPIYNKRSRAKKLLTVATKATDKDGYHFPEVTRITDFENTDLTTVLGVFRSKRQAKNVISDLAKEYELCPKRLQIRSKSRAGECFYRQLGQCRGACTKDEPADAFNKRFETAFANRRVKQWPHSGPIEISESFEGRTDTFVIDNWYLKNARTKSGSENGTFFSQAGAFPQGFNYDMYKILSQAVMKRWQS